MGSRELYDASCIAGSDRNRRARGRHHVFAYGPACVTRKVYEGSLRVVESVRVWRAPRLGNAQEAGQPLDVREEPCLDSAYGHAKMHVWRRRREHAGRELGSTMRIPVEVDQDEPGREARGVVVSGKVLHEPGLAAKAVHRPRFEAEGLQDSHGRRPIAVTFDGQGHDGNAGHSLPEERELACSPRCRPREHHLGHRDATLEEREHLLVVGRHTDLGALLGGLEQQHLFRGDS